jgi:putative ABC transport system ATP-binding protein
MKSISPNPALSTNPTEPVILLRDVWKVYRSGSGDVPALNGINLEVAQGEFLGIVGKSGAGKTTLLNMMAGIDHLTSGEVWVEGTPVHQLTEDQLARWRGKTLGVIYQSFQLLPTVSILDNVMLPVDFSGDFQGRRSVERALELLREVELEEHAWKLPSGISGGQQQRVAIARALINDPPVIVADEPTGRLDSVTADIIMQIFLELVKRRKTIVMVTHDTSLERYFDRVVGIQDGTLDFSQNLQIVGMNG